MLKRKDGFTGERCIVLPKMIIEMEKQDPLVSSLYITDIGYYPVANFHYREREDPIEQNVLIYCVEGTGWYQIGLRCSNRRCHSSCTSCVSLWNLSGCS